jgi:hypothetical protein
MGVAVECKIMDTGEPMAWFGNKMNKSDIRSNNCLYLIYSSIHFFIILHYPLAIYLPLHRDNLPSDTSFAQLKGTSTESKMKQLKSSLLVLSTPFILLTFFKG